jgi:serine/threonine protein kinase
MSKYTKKSFEFDVQEWNGKFLLSKDNVYHIIKYFGSSGFGHFFMAITSNHSLVILKIFHTVKDFEYEVETIKNIQKSYDDLFLPFIDYFIYTKEIENTKVHHPILVFKFIEGYISLSQHLENYMFFSDQREILKDRIKQKIQKIHLLNIVNNSLNLDNILIDPKTDTVKFMDLGLCINRWMKQLSENDFNDLIEKDLEFIETI